MKYDTVGLSPQSVAELDEEKLKIWNGTSWVLVFCVLAGISVEGSLVPDKEDQENAAAILEKALDLVAKSEHRYLANIRSYDPEKLYAAAQKLVDRYRSGHQFTVEDLNALDLR